MHELTAIFMVLGIVLLMGGFHRIDNAWNMDSGCVDMALNGYTKYTKPELYRQGLLDIFLGMLAFILACFIPGLVVKKSLSVCGSKNN